MQQEGRPIRYYKIIISDPTTGQVVTPPGFSGLLGGATYTSFVNGQTLPGAWNVELDLPVIDAATTQGYGNARVWGISVAEIAQANDLNPIISQNKFKNIAIFGGMQKGLPLANPAQSGLLLSGQIYQCFGNWIGNAMTLDFVIAPGQATASAAGGIGTLANPKNLTLNWQGGQPLGPALKSCLQTAFPGYTVNVNVNSGIVRPSGDTPTGFYPTLEQLSQDVRAMSKSIVKTSGYMGVSILINGMTITASDTASSSPSKAISYQDLIGQPTWLEGGSISLKTVMRADLSVLSQITLPQTIISNSSQSGSSLVNQKATFQGGFVITSLRHVGEYRNPSADAWVTVIEAAPNNLVANT